MPCPRLPGKLMVVGPPLETGVEDLEEELLQVEPPFSWAPGIAGCFPREVWEPLCDFGAASDGKASSDCVLRGAAAFCLTDFALVLLAGVSETFCLPAAFSDIGGAFSCTAIFCALEGKAVLGCVGGPAGSSSSATSSTVG